MKRSFTSASSRSLTGAWRIRRISASTARTAGLIFPVLVSSAARKVPRSRPRASISVPTS